MSLHLATTENGPNTSVAKIGVKSDAATTQSIGNTPLELITSTPDLNVSTLGRHSLAATPFPIIGSNTMIEQGRTFHPSKSLTATKK